MSAKLRYSKHQHERRSAPNTSKFNARAPKHQFGHAKQARHMHASFWQQERAARHATQSIKSASRKQLVAIADSCIK
jgi:hypothetical protein